MIFLSKAKPITFYYLISGLSFNAFVYFVMHYDSIILGNIEYWWFWAFYSIGQVISDLVMAIVLFNRNELQAMAKK
ncbi:hypothetical protein Q4596_12575 [Pseudoalteromonas carrageenovora]|uniref:hypothetical protein n=1 Tax=Pseudoalteromonas carrageenovora TaxID=227 RepID=UPI0026E21BB7|nr:hypothetical protein [Pseudoalteromonas carrageenovora]MDO6836462.1 hypothetical protein [Pseudoalteromonas carrageenovora]